MEDLEYHGKSSTNRHEKNYKRSNGMVPGIVHYLCGTGFKAFFKEPPSKVVYDNANELPLVCASREAAFFGKTFFLQDEAHHKNHISAPTHFLL
eukprot:scaffold1053_cov332-Pavlova_lutheri.AAC.16